MSRQIGVWRSGHDYYTPEGMEGVSGCRRCDGFEGTLPTHCPGVKMTAAEQEDVMKCRLEFVRGFWWRTVPRPEKSELAPKKSKPTRTGRK